MERQRQEKYDPQANAKALEAEKDRMTSHGTDNRRYQVLQRILDLSQQLAAQRAARKAPARTLPDEGLPVNHLRVLEQEDRGALGRSLKERFHRKR